MSDELNRHLQALRNEDPGALAKRYGLKSNDVQSLFSVLDKISPDSLLRKAAERVLPSGPVKDAVTEPISKTIADRRVESLRQTDAPSKDSMKPPRQGFEEKRKQAVNNALNREK